MVKACFHRFVWFPYLRVRPWLYAALAVLFVILSYGGRLKQYDFFGQLNSSKVNGDGLWLSFAITALVWILLLIISRTDYAPPRRSYAPCLISTLIVLIAFLAVQRGIDGIWIAVSSAAIHRSWPTLLSDATLLSASVASLAFVGAFTQIAKSDPPDLSVLVIKATELNSTLETLAADQPTAAIPRAALKDQIEQLIVQFELCRLCAINQETLNDLLAALKEFAAYSRGCDDTSLKEWVRGTDGRRIRTLLRQFA